MTAKQKKTAAKRKTNIFLIFLICSSFAWLISKLSETYTERASFELDYQNAPDSLLLTDASREKIDVRLSASGFQFLNFNFGKNQVTIDLGEVAQRNARFYVPMAVYRRQIENQLPGNMNLLEIDQDTLFLKFKKLYAKDVAVVANIELQMAQNHLLNGKLQIEPSTVRVKGPQNEIAELQEIQTVGTVLREVSEDFSVKAELDLPAQLENTSYSATSATISGSVFRFSEKIVEIPVQVINLPEGTEIKTFPHLVTALCKAEIDALKDLKPGDFELVADFDKLKSGEKKLDLELRQIPESIHSADLLENQVEFILIRR